MSEETLAQLPAGWHADPHGRYESRYFDGERWTLNVRDSTGGVTREPDAPSLGSTPAIVADPPPAPEPAVIAPAVQPAFVAEPTVVAEPDPIAEPAPLVEPEPSPVAPAGRSRVGLVVAFVLLGVVAAAVAFLVLARQ
jgi:hypothetical protein